MSERQSLRCPRGLRPCCSSRFCFQSLWSSVVVCLMPGLSFPSVWGFGEGPHRSFLEPWRCCTCARRYRMICYSLWRCCNSCIRLCFLCFKLFWIVSRWWNHVNLKIYHIEHALNVLKFDFHWVWAPCDNVNAISIQLYFFDRVFFVRSFFRNFSGNWNFERKTRMKNELC